MTSFIFGVLFVMAAFGCGTGTSTVQAPVVRERQESPATQESPPHATVPINGMACPFCTYNIQRQIQALDGVQRVDVSLEKGEAYVTLSKQNPPTADQLRAAVESAGFTPGEVRMP